MNSGPVGVFDSGVGGLSVLREIRRLLPREDLLYVADSGHCPYGGKPPDEIRARAHAIASFLVGRGAKAIVVACNTATVAAIVDLRRRFAIPIVGMEPAVKPATASTRSGVVGVLATGTTLAGDRFASLVERFANGVTVLTQPCPGLVEQVEAGDLDGEITLDLLRRYTDPLVSRGADTLVLGCTHYPFLRDSLAVVLGPDVSLVDTGTAVARQLRRVLDSGQLRAPGEGRGQVRFFTSATSIEPVLQRLWPEPVAIEPLPV
jgi:glutamate racemase